MLRHLLAIMGSSQSLLDPVHTEWVTGKFIRVGTRWGSRAGKGTPTQLLMSLSSEAQQHPFCKGPSPWWAGGEGCPFAARGSLRGSISSLGPAFLKRRACSSYSSLLESTDRFLMFQLSGPKSTGFEHLRAYG